MNKKILLSAILACSVFVISSCKTKVTPLSEKIAKVWTARLVKENNEIVYQNGATSNIKPGYSSYRLDLSSAPTAIIKDVDGGTYSGTYSLQGETKLLITGLNPQPTGTGGNLNFTITSIGDAELILTADQAYPKTGNTTNTYTLISAQ
ncbi:hypothetical protein GVN16_01305 [Emticicia sp. CRIBPO]|uniref:hypothetical protein n=1 Tax=Emticicia sp. CRIBPO TaxID=2683258 RepID=UPI001411CDA3|nr:hypothetical protein [Emticicia sp. CRIBPO]NBA84377.1 hypothetical protein [Emticicia sp. CRIBPO]